MTNAQLSALTSNACTSSAFSFSLLLSIDVVTLLAGVYYYRRTTGMASISHIIRKEMIASTFAEGKRHR